MGLGDNLIYPENIAWQYYAMYKHNPRLAHLRAYVDADPVARLMTNGLAVACAIYLGQCLATPLKLH
jgi:hypothetical protein